MAGLKDVIIIVFPDGDGGDKGGCATLVAALIGIAILLYAGMAVCNLPFLLVNALFSTQHCIFGAIYDNQRPPCLLQFGEGDYRVNKPANEVSIRFGQSDASRALALPTATRVNLSSMVDAALATSVFGASSQGRSSSAETRPRLEAIGSAPVSINCPGAYGPSFRIGDRFVVPYGGGSSGVYEQPNSQPVLERIPEGRGGVIIGQPVCKRGREGNLIVWRVRSDTGTEGWMSEGYPHSEHRWIAPSNR